MAVKVAFILVLAAACLKPTEGIPGTILEMVGAAMNKIPLYEKVTSAVNAAIEWTDAVADSTSKAFGAVRSTMKAMMGEIDGTGLVAIVGPLLKTEEIPSFQCLKGIKLHVGGLVVHDMVFHGGRVNFDETDFNVVGGDDEREVGEFQIVQIMFQFTDLQAPYRLTINTVFLGPHEGFIVFKFKGISNMILDVKVPTDAQKIRDMVQANTCVIEVQQIISELSSDMEIADSDYNSVLKGAVGTSVTEYFSIKRLIYDFDSITILKRSVAKTLLSMLEPVLNDRNIFCEIEEMPVIETPNCDNKEVYRMEVKKDGKIKKC